MQKIKLGTTDLMVSPINFGGNVFGWTLNEQESHRILDAFCEKGFNFIDTSDNYSHWVEGNVGGESESIIGNWHTQRKNRHDIVLATKCGGRTASRAINVTQKHIIASCDASLKRLNTDYIDLYYTHYDNESTPVEETLYAYQKLIEAGKVRYIGASNISPTRLMNSMETAKREGLPHYQVLQPLYNLIERRLYEVDYFPLVKKYNLAVLPYFSLASGFLTGKYKRKTDLESSKRSKFVEKYFTEKNFHIIQEVEEIANQHHSTPATIALAWLMSQPYVAGPIVSATSLKQLDAIALAINLKLSETELRLLNQISSF